MQLGFLTDDMISKFETFSKNNMDALYIIESMSTYWIQMLYELIELPIPGETGNRIIPIRESGIKFPGTRITPLREYGI